MEELTVHAMSIADLERHGLTPRIVSALDEAGILWESQLSQISDEQLLKIPNLGPASLECIRRVLRSMHRRRKREAQVVIGPPRPAPRAEEDVTPFSACQRCTYGLFCSIFTHRRQGLLHLCPRAKEQRP